MSANFRPRIGAKVEKLIVNRVIAFAASCGQFVAELPNDPFRLWAIGETEEGAEQALWLEIYRRLAREDFGE